MPRQDNSGRNLAASWSPMVTYDEGQQQRQRERLSFLNMSNAHSKLYADSFIRYVPPACFVGLDEPISNLRITLLPGEIKTHFLISLALIGSAFVIGAKQFINCSTRPRILAVDQSCKHFGLACAKGYGDSGKRVPEMTAEALAICQQNASSVAPCVIALSESYYQNDGQRATIDYPGLRAEPLWSESRLQQLPEARVLEENYATILAEFDELVRGGYIAIHPETLAKPGTWRVSTLWSGGKEHPNATARAPKTSDVWRQLQARLPRTRDVIFGLTYFSVIMPNSSITAHFGLSNMRLRFHLVCRTTTQAHCSTSSHPPPPPPLFFCRL